MSYKIDFFRSPHALAGADTSDAILVALSGGADSSCLLHILNEYSKDTGCKLYAAHINHNIRTHEYADEAERDERFCHDLCEKLGVELFVLNTDVPAVAKERGESLETAARRVRYDFFADVMQKTGTAILATAHNADDNLETQIFNLCRGCSADGLCGIPRTRPFDEASGVIVRPILDATKSDILDFCSENSIEYVTDSTNFEDDCTRNRIRHNIIPELVSLFGTPQRSAMRLAASIENDSDFLRSHAEDFINEHQSKLMIDDLRELHPSVMSRVIALIFKRQYGISLESVHITSISKLISAPNACGSVSLPSKIRMTVKRGELKFESDDRMKRQTVTGYEMSLNDGLNVINGTDFAIVVTEHGATPREVPTNYQKYSSATLYCNPNTVLSARSRREGDTILCGGMHKKLKKLMCDKKTEVQDRDRLPIICEDGQTVYVPLCAVADTAKASKNKKQIEILILKNNGEDQL